MNTRELSAALFAAGALALPAFSQNPIESLDPQRTVMLKYAEFDPAKGEPSVPAALAAGEDVNLWIVQFDGRPTQISRDRMVAVGAEVHTYLPENAYVVRMGEGVAGNVAGQQGVRYVGAYHPAYRLEAELLQEFAASVMMPARKFNMVVVDKRNDKPALAQAIIAMGGQVTDEHEGSILFTAELTTAQLALAARLDQVLWIDRWTAPEEDMDNARIQGGGDYVEAQGGYRGQGLNGHVYEGMEANHPDFTIPGTNVRSGGAAASHGHCTAGIVFGNGTSARQARGMADQAAPFYTNYSSVNGSRWQVVSDLVNIHDVSFTTASWGGGRTTQYTSVSADADDIIFDHDIAWTQSQSNAGNPQSRPQAWAKNIFSIGGVAHRDNSDRSDDSWSAGGGSTGPAADGRIKPTLSAYYDNIWTSDRTGSAGYSNGNSTTGFGGTSGATPIVAGHNALAIEMFTDAIFNNTLRNPGGSRHSNRPHFPTLKALMVANARQYEFTASSSDNRREHVGWGFPDLRTMYNNRARMFLVDETDILTQGASKTYQITVRPSDPELKIAMSYADPAGSPSASRTRINDLNLKVTAPNGTVYWGNNGLSQGNYSTSGGSPNQVDTVECVFVSQPAAGTWTVEVSALLIAQDSHVETSAIDADYGLAVSFGTTVGSIGSFGQGCQGTGQLPSFCAGTNTNGGTLAGDNASNEYGYEVSTSAPLQVQAVEFYTQANGGSATVQAAIYGAGPTSTALATASVTVGSAPGWYRATFASVVNIPAGNFYIAMDHTSGGTVLANLSGGTPGVGYWRRPAGSGTWAQSGIIDFPAVRALCAGGGGGSGAVPTLDVNGLPGLGETLSVDVGFAAASANAALLSGLSDQVFLGGNLPFDLGVLGAQGCTLYVSTEVATSFATNSSGVWSGSQTIPNSANLLGANIFQQAVILDAGANTLGIATTRAFRVVVGD